MNHIGGHGASWRTNLRAYDELPAALRAVVREAVEDWSIYGLRRQFEAGHIDAKRFIATIKNWDRIELAKRAEQRSLARGVYRGNVPERTEKSQRARRA